VNGDDDMGAVDESTAGAVTPPVDEDLGDIEDEARFTKRRTTRRHPRPKFRSERKARRTPR
jgi:hypothetical protein